MKISEAISRLNVLCAEYGDLDVVISSDFMSENYETAAFEVQNLTPVADGGWIALEYGNTHQAVCVF